MDINSFDVSPYFNAETISPDVTTTSSGSDGSEVTPTNDIDTEKYVSGFVIINHVSSINTSETFGFGLQMEASDADGGSKAGMTDIVIQAVTTAITGPTTAAEGSTIIPINSDTLHQSKRWVNFLVTPKGSRSGTDTCKWNAVFVGILKDVD